MFPVIKEQQQHRSFKKQYNNNDWDVSKKSRKATIQMF